MPAEEVGEWMTANSPGIEGRPRPAPSPTETSTRVPAGATGTILVVDDEHPFRLSAHRILTAQGYEVLHAATASEALRLCATHGEIDLVLTDLFLSDWQGDKLAAHLHRLYPALRVMFMSGDPAGNRLAGGNTFLAKPFSRQQLVSGITTALAS
jgi:CheY-like chemotaxis protein